MYFRFTITASDTHPLSILQDKLVRDRLNLRDIVDSGDKQHMNVSGFEYGCGVGVGRNFLGGIGVGIGKNVPTPTPTSV
jgi:hypothetical protein